ncbi:MAG: glycosyltransferase family 39 protein [Candidatus Promineofilum sp.]|nr:glycosyltransferase family 39 protein [Promineifilum sp.]
MFSGLALLLMVVSSAFLGGMLVRRFLPRGAPWNLALVFAALTLGIIGMGWLALVLAELGLFNAGMVLALTAVLGAALLVRRRPSALAPEPDVQPQSSERWATWERVMLVIWLATALWLFFRPHEYIAGAADAGVYVSLGAEIAQHGSFRIVDEALAALSPPMRSAVLRPLPNTPFAASYYLPGFYVTDEAAGRLTPQFYPLHPVLQAVAFGVAGGGADGVDADGVDAALLLTGLWMLLGTLAVYLTARDVGGPVVGALALAGLSLSALQVWFGRYPTSEALTQFLLWAGIWSGGRWLEERRPGALWAFAAGCAFGAVFLVRIDSLILLPIFALVLLWRWLRGWRRIDSWFAVPFVGLVFHSLLHGHFLSAPYFYETVGYGFSLLARLWPFLLAGLVGLGLVLLWLPQRVGRFRAPERAQRLVLYGLLSAWVGYALYGWFLRPELNTTTLRPDIFSAGQIPVTNHENWLRLGWYLTPLGIWLGVVGAGLMLWRVNRRTVLVLALGLMFSGVYLWNISANPHHVYVMRRYVPAVVPFFTLSAAYLLGHIGFRRLDWGTARPAALRRGPYPAGALVAAAIAVVWLAGVGWAARGFVGQVDYAGLTAQVDELAASLPQGAVVLFNDQSPVGQGDFWGTPLRFIYGYDVFALRETPEVVSAELVKSIESWQNTGHPVIWVGATDWLDAQGLAYTTMPVILETERLESSYEFKPQRVNPETTQLMLSYIERR